jgi:hypothetical protein
MKCHGHGDPAYLSFDNAMNLIFGDQVEDVRRQLAAGDDRITVAIDAQVYENLMYIDSVRITERDVQIEDGRRVKRTKY